MSKTNWIQTRIAQIASLSGHDGGGPNTTKIDSNAEFACLAKLLANCETPEEKDFVTEKMHEYLNGSEKEHFEHDDGTSYDAITDSTGNRMYVGYDKNGNAIKAGTTYIDENGVEVSNKEQIEIPAKQDSNSQDVKKNNKGFIQKHFDNVKQFYSDVKTKGIKEAYTDYWDKLF